MTATLSNSDQEDYLQGMPKLMGIVGGWWIHQANHNFFKVMREILFQVCYQILEKKKEVQRQDYPYSHTLLKQLRNYQWLSL